MDITYTNEKPHSLLVVSLMGGRIGNSKEILAVSYLSLKELAKKQVALQR